MTSELYILSAINIVGIASHITFVSLKRANDNYNSINSIDMHEIGATIGRLLVIGNSIYVFIEYKWYYPIIMLFVCGIIANIFYRLFISILDIAYVRLILIWVLPIIALLFFVFKIIF